jgi:hypothetical protein
MLLIKVSIKGGAFLCPLFFVYKVKKRHRLWVSKKDMSLRKGDEGYMNDSNDTLMNR